MPMRKSFRVSRELKHLTTTGGKGGRLHRDIFSDWKFECLPVACGNSVVTPAFGNELHTNVIGSTTYYLLPSGTTCGAVRTATSMARTCDERKHEVTPNQLVQSGYIQ